MSSSSSSYALKAKKQKRDWLGLPSNVTANILQRIGMADILENAQKVCTAWRKICKDPALWRVIKMNIGSSDEILMCKQAVDRSQGQLVDISLRSCDAELLSYVANRSGQLRRLEIVSRYGYVLFPNDLLGGIFEPLMKFPFLEELNHYSPTGVYINEEFIKTVGRYCPMLKTLKLNQKPSKGWYIKDANGVAIAIGNNLHELRHLELIGNSLSNTGLQVILDGCRHLETLDLRKCFYVDLNGDMGKRCSEQIKNLKLPNDSLEGTPFREIYEENLAFVNDDNDCHYGYDSPEGTPYRGIYEEDLDRFVDDDYYDYGYDSPELYDGYISQ